MNEILTFDELRQISGYQSLGRIKKWLDESDIKYLLDRHKRPLVNKYTLRYAMGGGYDGDSGQGSGHGNQEPNWDAI